MLRELYIENLAVIEKASIGFTESFNAFTGETGAGKSILINGINAILGQRVTKDIVRTGADKAVISGLFTDIGETVLKQLEEMGVDCEDGQLSLTREIRADGADPFGIEIRKVDNIDTVSFQQLFDLLLVAVFVRRSVSDDRRFVYESHHSVCVPCHIIVFCWNDDNLAL